MTDDELEERVLDLTDEWHFAEATDDAYNYSLPGWIAHNLDISINEANLLIYGTPRDDGAQI